MSDDDKPSAKNLENVEVMKQRVPIAFEINGQRFDILPEEIPSDWTLRKIEISLPGIERSKTSFTRSQDPGYCGLDPLVTGKRDPYWPRCKAHDVHYEKLKAASPDKTNMQVQAEFAKGVLSTAASGLYAFLTAPIYLIVGCIGGMARWTQLERRNAKARGEEYPSNTPED